jgi:phosphonatase-like hydrolase
MPTATQEPLVARNDTFELDVSNLDLVVFDMAGTTVNDRMADGSEAVNGCLRAAIAAAGVAVTQAAVNEVMGYPKPDAIQRLLTAYGRADLLGRVGAIHTDFVERMLTFYRTDPLVRPIAGAAETFATLRAAGVKVALDTGFSRPIAAAILDRLGWVEGATVDATITSDEVARGRPHPDMIRALMQRLNLTDPARVAKVGDTPSDLLEGTAAECGWVVGVTGGSHSESQLVGHPHTHLIHTVADLPDLFRA